MLTEDEYRRLSGSYPLLESMRAHKVPLDREHFIDINWPEGPPDPWGYEHEMQLPDPFRQAVKDQ